MLVKLIPGLACAIKWLQKIGNEPVEPDPEADDDELLDLVKKKFHPCRPLKGLLPTLN